MNMRLRIMELLEKYDEQKTGSYAKHFGRQTFIDDYQLVA